MSLKDGRELYARTHNRFTEEHLPPADTLVQRALLQSRARRGDQLAAKALQEWEAEHPADGGGAA
jgi:hypothetical protein